MKRLGMKNHNSARLTLARLIRAYHAGEMDSQTFRDLIYGFNVMLSYFRHAADLRIEDRLDEIENRLADQRKEGNE